ncbi:MAG: hypothetical protein H7837_11280 [Magnetococcus sp. MYC-9]
MTQNISHTHPQNPAGMNMMAFSPDSLQNPHTAVVFSEQEWEVFQGVIMEVWANRASNDGTLPSTGS